MSPPDYWWRGCRKCGTPEPSLPDPDAVMTWAEQHENECAKARKASKAA